MFCHSLGHFLNDWIEFESCAFEHADLLVEVNEVRLIEFILSILLQVIIALKPIQELAELRIHFALLQNILRNLLPLLGLRNPLIDCLAQFHQIVDHVLGDLDGSFGVAECLLVPVELAEQGAHLHVDFAFVFESF